MTYRDRRAVLDVQIEGPGREGLAGTTPANLYASPGEPEQVTLAPDGRPMDEQPAWRRDFPIDWPQDHYVERRDFVKFLFLTSLAFTVGQFWIAALAWRRGRRGAGEVRRVAALSDIPVGGFVKFNYPGATDQCVLVRPSEKSVVAYGQECTHLSCAVIPRVREGVLHCPCHHGFFDLASGRPLSGPPRRPLPVVRLRLDGDEVFAAGVEERTA
jgi:Rieske Fe-S protein